MAQGAGKKTAKPNPGLTKAGKQPKKSSGISKPQRAKMTNLADKQRKKYTGGMVAKTELMLGERAGHLELIGKGRKKGPNKDPEGNKNKGGTRKFG